MSFFYYSKHDGHDSIVNIFTLEFVLNDLPYHCIVRARNLGSDNHFRILILDFDMEELLPEQLVLVEKVGRLDLHAADGEEEYADVKHACGVALEAYLCNMRSMNSIHERFIA